MIQGERSPTIPYLSSVDREWEYFKRWGADGSDYLSAQDNSSKPALDVANIQGVGFNDRYFVGVQLNNPQRKARCSDFGVSVLTEKAIDVYLLGPGIFLFDL